MMWHIQFRTDTGDQVERFRTPERAIDAACRLLDAGYDVFGIGMGPLTDTVGRKEIAQIYAIWARVLPPPHPPPVDGSAEMRK